MRAARKPRNPYRQRVDGCRQEIETLSAIRQSFSESGCPVSFVWLAVHLASLGYAWQNDMNLILYTLCRKGQIAIIDNSLGYAQAAVPLDPAGEQEE